MINYTIPYVDKDDWLRSLDTNRANQSKFKVFNFLWMLLSVLGEYRSGMRGKKPQPLKLLFNLRPCCGWVAIISDL